MGGACAVFDDIRIGSFRDDLMLELGVAARDLRHFLRYIITIPTSRQSESPNWEGTRKKKNDKNDK